MIVWDAATKTDVTTLEGHTAEVTDAIELADKATVASNSKDKTIRLWNVVSWECVRVLAGLDNDSPKIAEIPDFRMLCVGSSTGHLKVIYHILPLLPSRASLLIWLSSRVHV
jgi:WD40 repeat protein